MAIDIKISDGIDSRIADKLLAIATNADSAQKRVDALVKRLNGLDASKIKSVSKAALDASKADVNYARASYYSTKEKVELAKLKGEQAKAAQIDAQRYHQFAVNSQKLATTKALDAEKIAQAKLASAEKGAKAAAAQAEALTRQAAANVKTQYQNQLLQYTGNWAKQDNDQRNLKTQTGQAQLGVAQARQDEILSRVILNQQKLNTEVARGAKENNAAAVAQQRLATEQQRTAQAAANAANAQQRLSAATARSQATIARVTTASAQHASNLRTYTTASSRAASATRDLGGAMGYLETSSSFLRSDGLRWAKVMWALSGATLTAGAIVGAADAYTLLQNRLSVVAETQESVNQLTEEMFEIAERSRQPVAEVTKAFSRFDMALREMGRSQKDAMVVTETVGKALQMSGATAGEAASAMLQLSQAFNKGKLDGDEFRSVMENAPLIANALAKELGVTRGELLKLAPAGKLTVEQLTNAIMNSSDIISEKFDSFKWTIGQSFTFLRNEMTKFFGELDAQVGFTQAIAAGIRAFADNLDTLLFVVLAVTPAIAMFVGTKTIAGFATLIRYTYSASAAIGAIRSPITVVSVALANMLRQGAATGAALNTMFASATTRAIGLQLAVTRAAAGVVALSTAAARAGTMMMAAFSFGNIVLLIGTLIAAAIAFGDQLEMAGEKSYTLRDYVLSALGEVWGFVQYIFGSIYDYIAAAFGASADEGATFGEKVQNTFESIVMFGAAMVDSLLHVLRMLWTGVKLAVAAVLDGVQAVVLLSANALISFVNTAINALNTLGSIANFILTATGADAIVGTFGEVGTLAAIEFKSNILSVLNDTDFGFQTGAMDTASAYLGRVQEGAERRNAKNRAEGGLRGYDEDQAAKFAKAQEKADEGKGGKGGKDGKGGKSAAERRADIIEKAMNAERKAIEVARRYGDERERVNVIEGVNNKLKEKGYAELSGIESAALSALVDQRLEAERVGTALQNMYESVVNPQREYEAGQKALNILMADGVVTAGRYDAMMSKLKDTFQQATDPAYELNKQLDALTNKEYGSAGKFGVDAEIAANVKAARDSGLEVDAAKIAEIEELTRSIYNMRNAQEAMNTVWGETRGAQEGIGYQIDAISTAYINGSLSISSYTQRLAALKAQQYALNEVMNTSIDPIDPIRQGMWQLVAEMPQAGQAMADAISSTLGNAIDNISSTMTAMIMNFDTYAESVEDALERPLSTMEVIRYALGDIITQIGSEMVNAIIKMGIQWAIQSAMQRTMETANAASTVATQASTAAAVTAAWAPAAAAASIATGGGAAATGLTGMQMAMIAATGLALAMIPAFKDGGEVLGAGTGRSDSIIARLSHGEHVVNADAASKHRPLLNAINSGADVGMGGQVIMQTDVRIEVNHEGGVNSTASGNEQLARQMKSEMERVATNVVYKMTKQGQLLYNQG